MLPLLVLLLLLDPQTRAPQTAAQRPAPPRPASPRETFFTSTLPAAELRNKQAVVETSEGTIVLDLLADAASNHVAHFITRAREGAYNGTTFHRVIAMGIIQGGDPLSKDPAQSSKYGSGGLNQLRFEPNAEKHTRGAVSAVLVPNNRDSGGNQFFIAVTDQPALDGQYTVFARVVEGINVAQKISTVPATNTVPNARIEIGTVTIREKPAPVPEPFSTETVEQLSAARALIETSMGNITFEFFPDRAPGHVRQFLRLASSGVYNGTSFHRIVKGFVIQGGHMPTRREPLDERQQALVRNLQPEFNSTPHVRGVVSMARLGDDPASASSSFFIVLAPAPSLDGKYTVFGRVVSGMDVIEKIEAVPLNGEEPVTRLEVSRVTVVGSP
ncbi:MAG TPA: peptidylprolyl isomerase [Vicinamibacterales bacterium]|nr:peptidylprolyl isomerase [Vicinamibacterales bacterium]